MVQVVVQRLNPEDGLYELSLPNKAVQVDDWSDLVEGALVEVRVTGHNTGGLECEVNHIRGFIPISQVSLYRVEDLAPYVDQRLTCVITEADPERRNLVLSRRAVLEREQEQAREQMLNSLRPGQIHEGVVRKLMDFGAFVDLGGVDGLVHVSQVAWGRVKHPSDVLQGGANDQGADREGRSRPPARSAWRIATCWKARGPRPRRNIRPTASSAARSPS